MSNDLMNVEAFANIRPADAFAALDPTAGNLADGIGSSYGIVHYKGKNWTLQYRGETYRFTRKDDGTPLPYLDVIILRDPGILSKSYYAVYEEGSRQRPICASIDGVRPDSDVQQKQSEACGVCPKNVWYQKPDGRRTRDCADQKRLALLILPSLTKAAMGDALMEPVFLRIPPGSLTNLSALGEWAVGRGFHYSSFVTRIGFDPNNVLKMTFKAEQPLTDAEGPVVLPMRESPLARRITGEDGATKGQARIATEPPPVQFNPAPQTAPRPAPPPTIDVAPTRIDTGFTTPKTTVLPPVQLSVVNNEVGESNPELDNRIANLLKTS